MDGSKSISFTNRSSLLIIVGLACVVLIVSFLYLKVVSIPVDVIVIAGQSNAVGIPIEKNEVEEYFHGNNDRALLWYRMSESDLSLTSGKWITLNPQKMWRKYVMGPEVTMGRHLTKMNGRNTAIIKVAFNGTALSKLLVSDWNTDSKDELYDLMINEVRLALDSLPYSYKSKIVGFVWLQGESDAQSVGLKGELSGQPTMANRYKDNLLTLIHNIRNELSYKTMPVLLPEISVPEIDTRGRQFSYRDVITKAQHEIASLDRNVVLIETNNIDKSSDLLHYSVVGQAELGQRMAEKLISHINEQ